MISAAGLALWDNGSGGRSLLKYIDTYTASYGSVSTWDYCLTYTVLHRSFIGEDK